MPACGCSARIRHAAICGWHISAGASTPKTATIGTRLTLPRSSSGDAPRRLPARVDSDDRIHGRRPAPACAGARFQPGIRCRVGGHCAALAANSQSRLGGARDRAASDCEARGVERFSKPWRSRPRWRCTTTAWRNRVTSKRGGRPVLEERNRMARDIHDTLAQGFGAILMQLQAAQRSAASLPPAVAKSLEAAVDLARTHMIDARRSVFALRPQSHEGEDVAAALQRMADLARRTTDVPIDLVVGELPRSAEASTARSSASRRRRSRTPCATRAPAGSRSTRRRCRSVGFRLSVADDGRGIAKERRDAASA